MYLTITRADIAHAVHIVSQFVAAPRTTHFAIVLCILCYVKGIMFYSIHFSRHSSLDLRAYSNADWLVILHIDAPLLVIASFLVTY